ncbi:helix-turn-helix transcriptional regulator [Poseidonocella sp. HB161398]|uniref:helix-turn-helix transcriptional regulator n=1 Tax=Poseidonocella sp. HB161398 TaxID=2320855 RepID=UPI0014861C0D|nr:helix-turn-helix transcriptional regulator [Poseidonocella sp. HB161398]
MQPLNFLIDLADRLQSCGTGPEAGWAAVCGVADSLDLAGMNAGAALAGSTDPIWARFHLPRDWEQVYCQEPLRRADPLWPWLSRPEPRLHKSSEGIAAQADGQPLAAAMRARNFNFVQVFKWQRGPVLQVLTMGTRHPAAISLGPELAALLPAIAAMMAGPLLPPRSASGSGLGIRYRPLTGRERSVLAHLACGLDNCAIAERMGIAEVTVRLHLKNARAKMGASTREQALALAMARGMLDL